MPAKVNLDAYIQPPIVGSAYPDRPRGIRGTGWLKHLEELFTSISMP